MTKRFGFTLAEVLITLGIIGVVAAMTMPTLMNQTQGAQYKTAYKKALSALSQAVTLNVALDEWNFADATGEDPYLITKMLSSRMNVVRTETDYGNIDDSKGNDYAVTLATGAVGAGTVPTTTGSDNTTLFSMMELCFRSQLILQIVQWMKHKEQLAEIKFVKVLLM